MTRIHNIGHIHKTNFAQTQFSRSYPQKTRFLKKRHFTFFWKYLVCGFKIEISEYPTKLEFITYTPYKYEVNRTKTHEIRAKSLSPFFFPLTVHNQLASNLNPPQQSQPRIHILLNLNPNVQLQETKSTATVSIFHGF